MMTSRRGERGFSLVETMVAITVFALITVGITPLLISSLRGSALSRSLNFSKNLVQESMERLRGLPYYDSATSRDLLDLYYPNLSTGYSATPPPTFTTTCTSTSVVPATTGAQACPPPRADDLRLPAGYTLTYAAQFVEPAGTTPETYNVVAPPTGYDAASASTSQPSAQLLRMTITISWSQTGTPRRFSLTSILGNRKLSPEKGRASANVDFTVQALTAYRAESPTRISALSAIAGRTVSQIELRSFSSAQTESSAGHLTLTREQYDAAGTLVPGKVLDEARGAESSWRSPASVTQTASTTAPDTVSHPDLPPPNNIGEVSVNSVVDTSNSLGMTPHLPAPPSPPVVAVSNGLPKAAANFHYDSALGTEAWWANNQADTSSSATLRLDPLKHVLSLFRLSESDRMRGYSYAEATGPETSQKSHAIAATRLPELSLLHSTITAPALGLIGDGVVVIQNFNAYVECKATSDAATSVIDGYWNAQVRYWRDTNNNGVEDGGYAPAVAIGGDIDGGFVDIGTAIPGNPLVIDAPVDAADVYLFENASTVPATLGFLARWSSTPTITSFKGAPATGGVETRVNMPAAITIVTARTDPTNPETKLTINIGKLSCRAVEQR